MSNHCSSLSCSFNFTRILKAWKTFWTRYKESACFLAKWTFLSCAFQLPFPSPDLMPLCSAHYGHNSCLLLLAHQVISFCCLNSFLKTCFFCLIIQRWPPLIFAVSSYPCLYQLKIDCKIFQTQQRLNKKTNWKSNHTMAILKKLINFLEKAKLKWLNCNI